jgi:hypothetical protein
LSDSQERSLSIRLTTCPKAFAPGIEEEEEEEAAAAAAAEVGKSRDSRRTTPAADWDRRRVRREEIGRAHV